MKVYRSAKAKQHIYETYDQLLTLWGVQTKEQDVSTFYGTTHVIECGNESSPSLVLFHGVGVDSPSIWIYNAKELAMYFRVYAIDTIGDPGKSCPNERYNKSFDKIKWLDDVFSELGLEKFYIAGVSNGSYIAQHYGIMRPDKVLKIVCLSGVIADKDIKYPIKRMLKVLLPQALFPTVKNTHNLIRKIAGTNYKAFTNNETIMDHLYWLLKGFNTMSMFYHKIVPFSVDQIDQIREKVLFLLGESDPLWDMQDSKEKFEYYQLAYKFFPEVGHGINHEIANEINKIIISTCTEDKSHA